MNSGSRASRLKVGVVLLVAALLVTNVMTWRALEREQAQRVAAERAHAQPVNSAPFVLSLGSQVLLRSQRASAEVSRMPHIASVAAAGPAGGIPTAALPNNDRLAERLAGPAARDALREQMKGPVLQLYGDLLKRWNLTGATAEPILDALAGYQSLQLVDALAPGSRAGEQADANAADNDSVRAALNAKQLEELRAYDTTLSDRQTIAPFLDQLELAQTPLSKDAAEQLINIMHDERVAVPPPVPPAGSQAPNAQPSGAYAQAMAHWQAELDQRIIDSAQMILSSDALARLQSFQTAQRAAASVFASINATDSVPPTVSATTPTPN